ncbi:hypothetical protein BRC94_06215 [Halobacteriales archaeon QS_5_70_17]|nr:MAG: hypothetical protein BRC94_06215 [Halobacteriales archaeon QS_5_70_17]
MGRRGPGTPRPAEREPTSGPAGTTSDDQRPHRLLGRPGARARSAVAWSSCPSSRACWRPCCSRSFSARSTGTSSTASIPASRRARSSAGPCWSSSAVEDLLARRLGVNVSLQSRLQSVASDLPGQIASEAPSLLSGGVEFLLGVLLLLFVEYYLLKDGAALASWVLSTIPLPESGARELFSAAEEMTWAVLKGHVLVAAVQGVVAGVGLFVAGVPNAALWTAVMAVLALVPVVGVAPVLGGAVLSLAVQGRVLAAALLLAYGATVVAVTTDGLFFGPVILGLLKVTVEVFEDRYDVA